MFFLLSTIYRLLANKETDALFALQEKRDVDDDVDHLLRTTKRFIGKSKVISPDHISIQRLSLIRLREDSGSRSDASKSQRKVWNVLNQRSFLCSSLIRCRNIFVLFVSIVRRIAFWQSMVLIISTFTIFRMAFVLAERSFIWTISVFMKFAGRVKTRMLNVDDNDND